MAVVINEMEVVVEPPSASPAAGQTNAPPPAQQQKPVEPALIEAIHRRLALYSSRVAAH